MWGFSRVLNILKDNDGSYLVEEISSVPWTTCRRRNEYRGFLSLPNLCSNGIKVFPSLSSSSFHWKSSNGFQGDTITKPSFLSRPKVGRTCRHERLSSNISLMFSCSLNYKPQWLRNRDVLDHVVVIIRLSIYISYKRMVRLTKVGESFWT